MTAVYATTTLAWAEGSALLGSPVRLVWSEGSSIYSTGGTYTPPAAPGGGTPAVPNLNPRFDVAAAARYNLTAAWAVTDLRDGQPVPAASVAFNTDEDSLFWAVSMSGGPEMYTKLQAGDQPPTVSVTLNGAEWRFVVEEVTQQRRHGAIDVRASGRSLTCLAGAPYEFEENWSLAGDTTAAQLAAVANANTGLQVEWGVTDWPIPDGVFSHTGTPMSVVKRVADAIGAMVLSDPKEFTVRVAPRYTLLPNEWRTVAPDARLAEDALEAVGYEVANRPAYDGVYVLGQQGGAAAFVRLAGTSGANLKPMVTDALLTDLAACGQRGQAELGRSGDQQRHALTMPVFAGAGEPGVLRVGWIVKVMESTPWWGVVRSVAVQAQLGSAAQTVVLERHTKDIPGTTFDPSLPTPLRFAGPVADQVLTPGASYSLALAGYYLDGVPPYHHSLRSGALPAWLALDGATGIVAGTVPGSVAAFSVRFRAADDAASTADSNEVTFTQASAYAGAPLVAAPGASGSTAPAYAATNANASWAPASANSVGGGLRKLVANSSTLLGLRQAGGLSRSTDAGVTWAQDAGSWPLYDHTDPVWNGSVWTIFRFGAKQRKSSADGGATWTTTAFTSGTHNDLLACQAADLDGTTAITSPALGSIDGTFPVYRSTDSGLTWARIDVNPFIDAFVDHVLALGGGKWLIFNGSYVFFSTDDGLTWTQAVGSVGSSVDRVVGAGSRAAALRSTHTSVDFTADGGANWTGAGLPGGYSAVDLIHDGEGFVVLATSGSGTGTVGDTILTTPTGASGTWTVRTGPGASMATLAAMA